ncbi:hypothetical protein [Protofrankia symbiont of Coriaria ruscifolia]|uniref:hypothetical protein n=1 Tax=Protofrankia symbiont of Coriaria ruscifolia TaxID=1306542 RepID=UPI0010410603|nr:hypothetical protein [Protofrankia symbiont of Coriaria ruscifolia]
MRSSKAGWPFGSNCWMPLFYPALSGRQVFARPADDPAGIVRIQPEFGDGLRALGEGHDERTTKREVDVGPARDDDVQHDAVPAPVELDGSGLFTAALAHLDGGDGIPWNGGVNADAAPDPQAVPRQAPGHVVVYQDGELNHPPKRRTVLPRVSHRDKPSP